MAKVNKRAPTPGEKPPMPALDPLEAALESARNAQEGNVKLARAVEALREGLETVVNAEWDHTENRAVTPRELREIAITALDAYTALVGQSWRRNPIVKTRVGDRSIPKNLDD
jgi:hypothetical protein